MSEGCRVEELDHTAEIGLRVWASSEARLFGCVGEAMFGLLLGVESDPAAPAAERVLEIEAGDPDSLLVDWLNELLYLHETTGNVYLSCNVLEWQPGRLAARVAGRRPLTMPELHIKAATYHQLRIAPEKGGWLAEVYFDI